MQFKNMNLGSTKAVIRAATASVLLMASVATSAATIEITPDPLNETVGNSFDLFLKGVNFDLGTNGSTSAGTSGGGVEISWDSSIIELQGDPATTGLFITFTGDQFFGLGVPIVLGASTNCGVEILAANCRSISFSVTSLFGDPNANFDIATLTFDAVAVGGPFMTGVTVSLFDVWSDFDSNTDMTPTGVGNTITINAVPVPAAVWLFGSGLLGLVGIARRRTVA